MATGKEIVGRRFYSFERVSRGLLLQRYCGLGFGIQDKKTVVDVERTIGSLCYQADHRGRDPDVKGRVEVLKGIRKVLERNLQFHGFV